MTMNRRDFLKVSTGASGSLILAVSIPGCASVQTGYQPETGEWKPDIWLELTRDDEIIFTLARVEMGQDTYTGLTTLVAEELDVEPSRIKVRFAPVAPEYRNPLFGLQLTGGSTSLATSWEPLRVAGAQARQMLVMAAARVWEVDADQCTTQDGRVVHPNGLDSLRYGQLVKLADREVIRGKVPLKPRAEWKYIGRKGGKLDARAKATGTAVYGMDVELPGMVYAVMTRSPRYGGKAGSFNRDEVLGMPGVTDAFITERGVALVAQRYWQARKAQQKLRVEWDFSDALDTNTEAVFESYRQAASKDPGVKERSEGNVEKAAERAKQVVEAEYEQPYLAHATMEPMNATAVWTEEKCEVWCGTQNGEAALAAAAEAAELPIEQCDVYKLLLGGGFGRRGMSDYVTQVVKIAKQMPGTPIKLLWTREEDMEHGFYHPITKARCEGALDADGNLTGLKIRISGQSIFAGLMPQMLQDGVDFLTFQGLLPSGIDERVEDQTLKYTFPALRVEHAMRNPPVRPGFWRGVNANQNAIYLECFMDELAHAAGKDPLEFRLAHTQNSPELAAVLRAVADKSGWGNDDGRSRGLCAFYSFGAYTAACAEVTVSEDGELKIHRIVAATDPGYAVNPQQIDAQVAGSFVYGLSAMLHEEITFENGETVQKNFDTYNSMRIAEMPEVETIVMPSGGFWGGVGEPTIAVAAPAVLNAIYAATGKRIRQLPLKDQSLRDA